MTAEVTAVFGKLVTAPDAEYLEQAQMVSRLADSMLHSASFADAKSAHVLIALARAFGALWAGLEGEAQDLMPGFAQASVESGFMLLSERLGTRIRSAEQAQTAKDTVQKVSTEP